jgi:predicted regulator of Ras-like GTPase activity (Roadblock/LC7/MglB family)
MSDLVTIANLQGVRGAVRGDLAGAFHDAVREQDGETIAAVMGFVSSAVIQAGEQLGLGALRRISISGETTGCVVAVEGDSVVTAWVAPGKPLATVEKFLEARARGRE